MEELNNLALYLLKIKSKFHVIDLFLQSIKINLHPQLRETYLKLFQERCKIQGDWNLTLNKYSVIFNIGKYIKKGHKKEYLLSIYERDKISLFENFDSIKEKLQNLKRDILNFRNDIFKFRENNFDSSKEDFSSSLDIIYENYFPEDYTKFLVEF